MNEQTKKTRHFSDRKCPVCEEYYTPVCGNQKYCPTCGRIVSLTRKHHGNPIRQAKMKRKQESKIAPGCTGCWYWRFAAGDSLLCCHYCLDNEQKRPCKPGKDCTVRIPATRKRKGATT